MNIPTALLLAFLLLVGSAEAEDPSNMAVPAKSPAGSPKIQHEVTLPEVPHSQGQEQMDASGASGIRELDREDSAEHLRDIKELQRLHGSGPMDWANPDADAEEDGRLRPGATIKTPESTAGFESMAEDCRANPDTCLGGALNDPHSTPGSRRRGPRDANAGPSDDVPDPRGMASDGVWRSRQYKERNPHTGGTVIHTIRVNTRTGVTYNRSQYYDRDGNPDLDTSTTTGPEGTVSSETTVYDEDGSTTTTTTQELGGPDYQMTVGPVTGGSDDQPVPHDGTVDSRLGDCVALGGGLGTVGRCERKQNRVQDPYETPSQPQPDSEGESTSRRRSGHSGPGLGAEAVTDTGGSDWSVPGRSGGSGIETGPGIVDPDFGDPEPPDPSDTGRSGSRGNVRGVSAGGDAAAMDGVMEVLDTPPGLPKQ